MAQQACERGERLLQAEASRPRDPFRHALMCSRFFRAQALVIVVHGGRRTPAEATRLALDWHDHAEKQGGPQLEHRQLLAENRRLVLEAGLKLATRARDPKAASLSQDLLDLDGEDPDCLAFAAEGWTALGHWRHACALYLRAMRKGTIRGVMCGLEAAELLAHHGRAREAGRTWTRALALDRRCLPSRQRLAIGQREDDTLGLEA
jgi:hypothetical protein